MVYVSGVIKSVTGINLIPLPIMAPNTPVVGNGAPAGAPDPVASTLSSTVS